MRSNKMKTLSNRHGNELGRSPVGRTGKKKREWPYSAAALVSVLAFLVYGCGGGGGGGGGLPPVQQTEFTWKNPVDLSDNISPNGTDASICEVAMDDNGNAIIVWNQNDGYCNQIFKSEYRDGVWMHPSSLWDNISLNGAYADFPEVAMGDNGSAIIVWSQSDGSYSEQIFKSEYHDGVWAHPANFADNISPDGTDAEFPQVAMDDNGNAVIVWRQSDGHSLQIFKSELR